MAQRVGRISEVVGTKHKKGIVPVSRATWLRWVAAGTAPASFKLGPGTVVWDLDAVEAFVAKQAAATQEVAA